MKRHFFPIILFICLLQLQAQPQEHTLQFMLTFNGETLEMGKKYYLPSIKDSVELETLRFYVSDLQWLQNEEIVAAMAKKHWLIDAEKTESLKQTFTTDSLSKKLFNKLQFQLGIDSLTNVSGAFGGDLDPTNGMYWTWQSGYINFKLEGISKVCPARKTVFNSILAATNNPSMHCKT
ncbi:MAG: MbnP family protein [Chitinophagales bacterium]